MSRPTLLAEARDLRLKKRFAQHFLVDEAVLDRIVLAAELQPGQRVLEIGPGAGFLTRKLLDAGAQVVAVELERAMAAHLRERFAGPLADGQLTLVEADFLRFDLSAAGVLGEGGFSVVGNLPYNLSTPILFHLVGEIADPHPPGQGRIRRITVMVQREVGERLAATPGRKAYNALSIAAQYRHDVRLAFTVRPAAFHPPPRVESAVVTLTPLAAPRTDADPALLARLVRAAFAQRRKTLRRALANAGFGGAGGEGAMLEAPLFEEWFAAAGVDPGLRAEALSIEALGALVHARQRLADRSGPGENQPVSEPPGA